MTTETKTCVACGATYSRSPRCGKAQFAKRKYCSRSCPGMKRPDVRSDYRVTVDGCWEWLGHIDRNGYGRAYEPTAPAGKRTDWAHRVSYRVHVGQIPPAHDIDHTCQNTCCINPSHLEVVTRAEHVARTFARLGKDEEKFKAAALRGGGLTYAEIAEALHLAGRESAHGMVKAAIRKGLVAPSSLPPSPFLSEDEKSDVRDLHAMGIPQTEIAAWYGIDSSNISRLLRRRTT